MHASRRIGLNLVLSKISNLLFSAKTTLPVLLNSAGAPAWMAQLLVPIQESGSLLPQVLLAKVLRNKTRRDLYWQASMALQILSGISLVAFGLMMSGLVAGIGILLSLVLMSLSKALASLINKDIQGQHVKKGARGRLIGAASTISSFVSIGVAISASFVSDNVSTDKLILLTSAALFCKLACMIAMRPLKTYVKVDDEQKVTGFFYTDTLKRFVITRALFSHTALLAPVFVLMYAGKTISILSYLIVAQALAGFTSSYLWGYISDRSALWCMRLGASVALLSALTLLFVSTFASEYLASPLLIVSLFFTLSVGHEGARTGRKIYGVDISEDQHRTEFIASANTAVGIFILVAGAIYAASNVFSSTLSLSLMTVGLVLGLFSSLWLRSEKT